MFHAWVVMVCGCTVFVMHVCACERGLLTLPPATTDFPEAGSITQPVEPLLFNQLHDLGLDLLPQLPLETQKMNTKLVSEKYQKFYKPHRCRCGKSGDGEEQDVPRSGSELLYISMSSGSVQHSS